MEIHAAKKHKALAKVKKNYSELLMGVEDPDFAAKKDADLKAVKSEYAQVSTDRKNKIKARFNVEAESVCIDVQELVQRMGGTLQDSFD